MKKPLLIEIRNLCKQFPQQETSLHALRDVTFSVEEGDIFGIIGLSGAGKSTLIRCLATLEKPTAGSILFQGNDLSFLKGKDLRSFRKKIGMIFQHFNLLSARTVFGNVAYALEINGIPKDLQYQRTLELLKLVDLENKKDAYPSALSGGQKQRVGIARALANHPQVLFCDEATSALDPKTTQDILNLLKDLNRKLGITIVLITHEMQVIKQICNKIVVLEKGEIVETGTVAQVFSDPHHPVTKTLLQNTIHEIPSHFFKEISPYRKLLRLSFKGEAAKEPLIAQMIKRYQVDANILLGWIDSLETTTVGTLIIEISGEPNKIEEALVYLKGKAVHYEVIENHGR